MGASLISASPMTGGLTSSCHRLELSDGGVAVLRRWTSHKRQDVAEFSPAREATALASLRGTTCPVPQVLGRDDHGIRCDVPALILTCMPGSQPKMKELASLDLLVLATVLAKVHEVAAPPELPAFAPWCWRHPLGVPIGSQAKDAWRRIIEAVPGSSAEEQQAGAALLHGDFHAGNTLWSRSGLSAVLDWPAASRGNPLADVARMAGFLDVLLPDAGRRFAQAYASLTGRVLTPWWEAREVLDRLPEDPEDPLDLGMFDRHVRDVAMRL